MNKDTMWHAEDMDSNELCFRILRNDDGELFLTLNEDNKDIFVIGEGYDSSAEYEVMMEFPVDDATKLKMEDC